MQHRQMVTYFYSQLYLKYLSQFLTQAPQVRVVKIIDKRKTYTIMHTLFCLAYVSYLRIEPLYYEEIIVQKCFKESTIS